MSGIRGFEWPLVASFAAAVVLAVPLWCVTAPGMPDYPAHLASFALIAGTPSPYYTVGWDVLPNLASEALVPLLAHLMPLEIATRLFLTATIALWVLGPALIQRALLGRANAAILFAAFFAYNANFMWGFFNYSFATGLAFVIFAAWIATDGRRPPLHLAGLTLAFTLLYLSHLFALAVLLLAIGCFELSGWMTAQPRDLRSLVARCWPVTLAVLPAFIAFVILKPAGAGNDRLEFDYADSMLDRAGAALQFGFDNPSYLFLAALVLTFAIGLITRTASVHPRMRLLLVVFALCALLAPQWAMGGWGVHLRLPAVLGALAFASLDWKAAPRMQIIAAATLFALLGGAAFTVVQVWHGYDTQYTEFRNYTAGIKANGRLLTVLDGDSLGEAPDQPYWHLAEFAVIDRGVLTPLMFTTVGQHVIHIRPPFGRIVATNARQGSPPDIDELDDLAAGRRGSDEDIRDVAPYLQFFQCHYDQAVVIHGEGRHARVPTMLRFVKEGSFYTLYDIVPDQRCAKR